MSDLPPFKTLQPYRDPVSAREWNLLTAAVAGLCRSLGVAGLSDPSGLHIRSTRRKHWPPYYRILSNDGGGRYTLRPQAWKQTPQQFADAAGEDDIAGYEIAAADSAGEDRIVQVHLELSLEGQWVGLFELQGLAVRWGVAQDDWATGGNVLELTPCDDEQGSNPQTGTTVSAYVFTPLYNGGEETDIAPDGLEVKTGDVLAYLPCGDGTWGVLVNPPLRLPPAGAQYEVMQKLSGSDYDYGWGPAHFMNVGP